MCLIKVKYGSDKIGQQIMWFKIVKNFETILQFTSNKYIEVGGTHGKDYNHIPFPYYIKGKNIASIAIISTQF